MEVNKFEKILPCKFLEFPVTKKNSVVDPVGSEMNLKQNCAERLEKFDNV
jgi:hypothetical protein